MKREKKPRSRSWLVYNEDYNYDCIYFVCLPEGIHDDHGTSYESTQTWRPVRMTSGQRGVGKLSGSGRREAETGAGFRSGFRSGFNRWFHGCLPSGNLT